MMGVLELIKVINGRLWGRRLLVFLGLAGYLYGWTQLQIGGTIPDSIQTLGLEETQSTFKVYSIYFKNLLFFLTGGIIVLLGAIREGYLAWRDKNYQRGFPAGAFLTGAAACLVAVMAGPAFKLFIAILACGGIISWLFRTPVQDKGIY